MKLILFFITVYLITGCNSNNSNESEKKSADKTTKSNNSNAAPSTSTGGTDDIVGEWEMVGSVVDTNDNLLIDEEERKNLKKMSFENYMKLNADGTGLFTIGKMEGRYEIKEESNGRKFMTWYDKANGKHRVGSIMKVTKDELTIKEPGGYGLFLWKRI